MNCTQREKGGVYIHVLAHDMTCWLGTEYHDSNVCAANIKCLLFSFSPTVQNCNRLPKIFIDNMNEIFQRMGAAMLFWAHWQ